MIKSVVASPFIPPASFIASHRAAQAVIYADQIKQNGEDVIVNLGAKLVTDFNDFDRLYVYHGNDWGGGLNLYGGCEGFPYAYNTKNISKFRGEVYSLGFDFPDYHGLLSTKFRQSAAGGKKICTDFAETDLDNLLDMQKRAITLKYPRNTGDIVVGDSHSICLYRPDWTVNSVPYKTLFGALEIGLEKFVLEPSNYPELVENVELYFGNIDIRHHLLRQSDPSASTVNLCNRYCRAAIELYDHFPNLASVNIYEPLPIEDESRPIPTSGYFKGTPFYGSWVERNDIRKLFRNSIYRFCLDYMSTNEYSNRPLGFVQWTDYLLNDKGELDLKKMEYKKSVHLSRAHYPYWTGAEFNEMLPPVVRKSKKNTLEEFIV